MIPDPEIQASDSSATQEEYLVMTDTPLAFIVFTDRKEDAVLWPHQLQEAPGQHRGLQTEQSQAGGGGWLNGGDQELGPGVEHCGGDRETLRMFN